MNAAELTSEELGRLIAALQKIQAKHHYTDRAWEIASELLRPCFAEAAARQQRGETVPEYSPV